MPDPRTRTIPPHDRRWRLIETYSLTGSGTGTDYTPFDRIEPGDFVVLFSGSRGHYWTIDNLTDYHESSTGGGGNYLSAGFYEAGDSLPLFNWVSGSGYGWEISGMVLRPPVPIKDREVVWHQMMNGVAGDLPTTLVPAGGLWVGIHTQLQTVTAPDRPTYINDAVSEENGSNGSTWGWWYSPTIDRLVACDSNGGSTNAFNYMHVLVVTP